MTWPIPVPLRGATPVPSAILSRYFYGELQGRVRMDDWEMRKDVQQVVSDLWKKVEIKKLNHLIGLFKKYGDRYDFNFLKLSAQAYQEYGLDNSKQSPTGAIAIMQVLPRTAADSFGQTHKHKEYSSSRK
jgi:hypothetical protein